MDQVVIYAILLGIIALVGIVFQKTSLPTSLLLMMVGMILSFVPLFPKIYLNPNIVLEVFLPLLIYQVSIDLSWRDVVKNMRSIALLSIGHVLFITLLVAVSVHFIIPEIGWPLACVLGAVISPTDDVAIVSIAEKVNLPKRIITTLKGEGLFSDATALILFRLSLAAVITHQFEMKELVVSFLFIVVGETIYGIALGYLLGEVRKKISDPILQMIISILTPFLAYLPAEKMGGSGVISTSICGLIISYYYLEYYTSEVRLIARSIWKTLGYITQGILFLLVGLDLPFVLERFSILTSPAMLLYSLAVAFVVIGGRFLWVWGAAYIPNALHSSHKKTAVPKWQELFIISWSGMRGGISLAAALVVPSLPPMSNGMDPRDLLLLFVFTAIIATLLIQGLTLPWLIEVLGITKYSRHEQFDQHLSELNARLEINREVLRWLMEFKKISKGDKKRSEEIKFRIQLYSEDKTQLEEKIKCKKSFHMEHEKDEINSSILLSLKILEIERSVLMRLWHDKHITHEVKNKLLQKLDHQEQNLTG